MPNVAAFGRVQSRLPLPDPPRAAAVTAAGVTVARGRAAVGLLARRGRKYATLPHTSSLQLDSPPLPVPAHPACNAGIHRLGEITPCGAYVVVVWMCGVATEAAAASCAITSITIFMTLSRVSRPTEHSTAKRAREPRQRRKAIKPVRVPPSLDALRIPRPREKEREREREEIPAQNRLALTRSLRSNVIA